jgi:hypothetical protein
MNEPNALGEMGWTETDLPYVRSIMVRIAGEEERNRKAVDKKDLREEVRKDLEGQVLAALNAGASTGEITAQKIQASEAHDRTPSADAASLERDFGSDDGGAKADELYFHGYVRLPDGSTEVRRTPQGEGKRDDSQTATELVVGKRLGALDLASFGQKKWSIADILGQLLEIGQQCKVSHIRYYHYQDTGLDGQLVVVDSAGHDPSVAQHLRGGPIVKFKSACPLATVDSFWCLQEKIPVLFSVEPNASSRLDPILYPGELPWIRTPLDNCEKDLANHKSSHWIDIPLFLFDKFIGKLTCDVEASVAETGRYRAAIMRLWAAALQAAPYLEGLYREQFDYPLAEVIAEVHRLKSTDEVFQYCVTNLPLRFHCRHCRAFERQSDDFQSAKLILRQRSNGCNTLLKSLHMAIYDLNDEAPTAWVARNNIPLRLQNVEDEVQRERQLSAYRVFDSRLNWDCSIGRKKAPHSYLAIPISTDLKEVAAVLRFTEKIDENGRPDYFTERDQALLSRIANEIVGPRLEALRRTDLASDLSFEDLEKANSLLVERTAPTSEAIAKAVLSMLESFFPQAGGRRKLYLLNVLEPGGRQFVHHQIGGSLGNDLRRNDGKREIYPLEGSLTGHVIDKFLFGTKRDDGTVFIVDFEKAIKQGAMISICKRGKTALACPMVFRDRVYGAIVVKSSHYDLDPLKHGKLLRLVAAEAAAMFARRECECLQRLQLQDNLIGADGPPSSVEGLRTWLEAMEKTYHSEMVSQSFPKPDVVNVRDTMTAAANDAVLAVQNASVTVMSPLELNVPDVEVSTYRATLARITYSVLRDIFTRQPASAGPVSVLANVEDPEWLNVSIGTCAASPATPTCEEPKDDVIDQCLRSSDSDCVTDPEAALAHLHQFAGGRRGVLRAEAPDRVNFRLPIDLVKRNA